MSERQRPTAVQRRMWFAEQVDSGGAYLVSLALRLEGALDVDALFGALNDLIERHEALRSTFAEDGDELVLTVRSDAAVPVAVVDLSDVDAPAAARTMHELLLLDGATPVDLSRSPLIRVLLVRVATDHHMLSISTHHIACDGWSGEIIARELGALYTERVTGIPSDLRPLAAKHSDIVRWEQEWGAGPARAAQLAYWRNQLAGVEPVQLPKQSADVEPGAPAVGEVTFEIDQNQVEALSRIARSVGASSFMTFLALFGLTIARFQAGGDVLIGTPAAIRARREFEDVVGCFVNTVAIRIPDPDDLSFRRLVEQVRETVIDAQENQELPFDELVDDVNPARTSDGHPLFRVEFSVQAGGMFEGRFGQLRASRVTRLAQAAKFDVAVHLETRREGVHGVLRYRPAALDSASALQLVEHLDLVGAQVTAHPDIPLGSFALVTDAEKHCLLEEWNGSHIVPSIPCLVPDLIAAHARLNPDALAVDAGGICLTYRQLLARADAWAGRLIAAGAAAESIVAVMLPAGAELVCVLLGVLRSGAAYQPIDLDTPPNRVATLLADTSPICVVVEDAGVGDIPAWVPVVRLGEVAGDAPVQAIDVQPDASAAAYVIHTSGSTGRPKAVVVQHGSLAAYVGRCVTAYPALGRSSVLHTPVAYDLAVTSLWGTLAAGGKLLVRSVRDLLAGDIPAYAFLKVTPGQLPLLDAAPASGSPAGSLMSGGEVLPADAVRTWRRRRPNGIAINHYGPTETTVGCTDHVVLPGVELPSGPVPTGKPFPYVRAYVLDRRLRLGPPGVAGELYIGGLGVARGYLGNARVTAHRFVADPWGVPGARMYRTGDLARWDADGHLHVLGRTDDQIKIRGYRVEPAETQAVFTAHPDVASAAVVVVGTDGSRQLVAYVTPSASISADALPATLRTLARQQLPAHLRPAHVVVLDELPLTNHGKLDRTRLPQPDEFGAATRSSSDPMTVAVTTLVGRILERNVVESTDDFFAIGGNSLLALRFAQRVESELGRVFDVVAVFDAETIADLVTAVVEAPRVDGAA